MPVPTNERIAVLEGDVKQLKKDAFDYEERQTKQGDAINELKTDRAKVVFGAWVANGLTCVFVGAFLFIGSRLLTAEALAFKANLLEEIRAANVNAAVKH